MIAVKDRAVPDALPLVQNVIVFRALNLGDMLCSVPALRALRQGLPAAEIALLGLPWASRFAVRFHHYIDRFVEFPGHPALPERQCSFEVLGSILETIRRNPPDLAIQMHGSGRISNEVVVSLGARLTAGFHPVGRQTPGKGLFLPYPETLSEVERNLLLIRHLGLAAHDPRLEFPFLPGDAEDLARFPELEKLQPGSYVCIHPGASVSAKCWPVEHFAVIAYALRERGLTVVVTGNRRESDLASAICTALDGECVDAASSDLGLGSLALLIRNARLLLCNDTGVSHLAAALRVPSVVVFTRADPGRWAPSDRKRHRVIGGPGIMPSIQEVSREVKALLSRNI